VAAGVPVDQCPDAFYSSAPPVPWRPEPTQPPGAPAHRPPPRDDAGRLIMLAGGRRG